MALNYDKLVNLLKKKDIGHSAAAAELGLTTGQISSLAFSQALVDSGRVDTAPSTDASVKKLRAEGNRFELIAARTGKSVGEVKEILGEMPRGSSSNGASASTGSKSKSKSKTAGKSKTKTAGRKAKASTARPARRARTLAERRAARAGNPS
jgi:hypothetical protein